MLSLRTGTRRQIMGLIRRIQTRSRSLSGVISAPMAWVSELEAETGEQPSVCPDLHVLEMFVDCGQLDQLRLVTISPSWRRTPGSRRDNPRLLAVLQAMTCFAFLAGHGLYRATDLHPRTAEALGKATETYTLGQLPYDLAKLRGKGLVERIVGTQAYRLRGEGYRIAVLCLKLSHRIYAPLTAGTFDPVPWDDRLPPGRRASLDSLSAAGDSALNRLLESVGVRFAA